MEISYNHWQELKEVQPPGLVRACPVTVSAQLGLSPPKAFPAKLHLPQTAQCRKASILAPNSSTKSRKVKCVSHWSAVAQAHSAAFWGIETADRRTVSSQQPPGAHPNNTLTVTLAHCCRSRFTSPTWIFPPINHPHPPSIYLIPFLM